MVLLAFVGLVLLASYGRGLWTSVYGILFKGGVNAGADNLTAFAGLITILILLATAMLTFIGYRSVRDAQMRIKTLEFIEKTNEDDDIFTLFEQLRYIIEKYDGNITFEAVFGEYKRYASGLNEATRRESLRLDYDYIIHLLNFYETWAIGVNKEVLDEEMLYDWWRATLILHWTHLLSFVFDYRRERATDEAYEHVERMATRWANADDAKEINARIKKWREDRFGIEAKPQQRLLRWLRVKKAA
ncbi:MAG: DUF4760 domain-containing protein [Pseudomonadota bacterium]